MSGELTAYQHTLRRARDEVFVVAHRHGLDTRQLSVDFDVGRGPDTHTLHTLTISTRNAAVAVTAHDIPHEWLSEDTGFVDPRFAKRVGALLIELHKKAQEAGQTL